MPETPEQSPQQTPAQPNPTPQPADALSEEERASRTARPSFDSMALGRTPGQRGAEILAGLRAELMNTPEAAALSRLSGRIVARIIRSLLGGNPSGINFVLARLYTNKELIRRALPPDNQPATVVEVAAGFSPRGFEMAREHPHTQIIEVDLPDVVEEKQKRLRRARNLEALPPNLSWLSADLGVTPLAEVLSRGQVDVIVAEGLLAYFTPAETLYILSGFRASLKPGGVLLADIPRRQGMLDAQSQSGLRMFSRQAGSFVNIAASEEAAGQQFLDAGYTDVTVDYASQMAELLGLPTPVLDFAYFVAGRSMSADATADAPTESAAADTNSAPDQPRAE
ncbi:MAG: hypothetical protein GYB67_01905 [Chloroflexi bacterium]|nr:hypothetical protein [Chloroflexota bacterium]